MAFSSKRKVYKGELSWQKSYIRRKYMSTKKTVWMSLENTISILISIYVFQKLV